jgi:hypothetical protein
MPWTRCAGAHFSRASPGSVVEEHVSLVVPFEVLDESLRVPDGGIELSR